MDFSKFTPTPRYARKVHILECNKCKAVDRFIVDLAALDFEHITLPPTPKCDGQWVKLREEWEHTDEESVAARRKAGIE